MPGSSQSVDRTVNIYINQASAEKAYQNLQAQQDKLTDKINKGTAAGRDMTKELADLEKVKGNMQTLADQISGKVAASFNQVKARVQELQKEIQKMSSDAPGYAEKFSEFQTVSKHFNEMKANIDAARKAMNEKVEEGGFLDKIKEIGAGVASGEFLVEGVNKIKEIVKEKIEANAELSDSLAEVQDTTGLAGEALLQFDRDLKSMDTRTSTEQLRELASLAGEIGAKKADLEEFVRAADMINVAMDGDPQLIKDLSQQYKTFNNVTEITPQNLLQTANGLQGLKDEFGADKGFVLDFAQQIMGLSGSMKLTQADAYGMAGALSAMGLKTQNAVSGVIKIFTQMGTDTPKYSKLAGMGMKEFASLVANEPVKAMLAVTKGLAGNKTALAEWGNDMKSAGLSGARTAGTISLIGSNAAKMNDIIDHTKELMKETGDVEEDFNRKNNNLAGNLAKIGKAIKESFTDGAIAEGLNKITIGIGKFLGVEMDNNNALEMWNEQKKAVANLDEKIVPLLEDYDTLSKKAQQLGGSSKLSKEEQEKLKNAIDAIAGAIPSAITETDKYGNAMNVNTTYARQYVTAMKAMLEVRNKDAIKEQTDDLDVINRKLKEINATLSNRGEAGKQGTGIYKKVYDTGNELFGDVTVKNVELSNTELKKLLSDRAKLLAQQLGYEASLRNLKGLPLVDKPATEAPATPQTNITGQVSVTAADKAKAEAALKAKQDLADKIKQIGDNLLAASKGNDEKEIQAVRDKYNALLKEAHKYAGMIAELNKDEAAELDALYKVQFSRRSEQEYDKQLADTRQFYQQQKNEAGKSYANGLISEKAYNDKLAALNADEVATRIQIAKDYMPTVAKAEKDMQDAQTEQVQQGVDARRALSKKDNTPDAVYDIQTRLLAVRQGSAQELELQKTLLQKKFELETQGMDKTSALYRNKQAQLNSDMEDLDQQYVQAKIQAYGQMANQIVSFGSDYFSFLNQQGQDALQADQQASQQKQQQLQQELDNKQISQAEYNRQTKTLNDKMTKEEHEQKVKAFNQNKEEALAKAAISEALAIAKILEEWSYMPPYAAVLEGITIAAMTAQIGLIAAQKPPQYEQGGISPTGGVPAGPSHKQGGINLVDTRSGQVLGNIQGGEPILSRETYANNKSMVDALLYTSMYNGGKSINWYQTMPGMINYRSIARAYQGVAFGNTNSTSPHTGGVRNSSNSTGVPEIRVIQQPELINAVNTLNGHLRRGISAQVNYNDIVKRNQEYQLLIKESSTKGWQTST